LGETWKAKALQNQVKGLLPAPGHSATFKSCSVIKVPDNLSVQFIGLQESYVLFF